MTERIAKGLARFITFLIFGVIYLLIAEFAGFETIVLISLAFIIYELFIRSESNE